jgi:hypothetical protein
VYGAFADGSLLMAHGMESAGAQPATGVWRDTMVLLRIGRTGQVLDTVGRFPGPARYAAAAGGGGMRTNSVPFGPVTSVLARGDAIYVSTGDRYEIAVHDPGGRVRRLIRRGMHPVPVTRQHIESYTANMLQAGGTARERRERQEMIEVAPFPRTMAAVESLGLDQAGNLWAREPQSPDTWNRFSRWSVFDATGRWIATVEGPGRFAPEQIGPDWVLGRQVDAEGTERVRLYGLRKN